MDQFLREILPWPQMEGARIIGMARGTIGGIDNVTALRVEKNGVEMLLYYDHGVKALRAVERMKP